MAYEPEDVRYSSLKRVGTVVPTLGTRHNYLVQSLQSIRESRSGFVLIVAPDTANLERILDKSLYDQLVHDRNSGLGGAINLGIQSLPREIEYVSWLGDDDLLTPDSLSLTSRVLEEESEVVMVFGKCVYIDEHGSYLGINPSGQFASRLLRFGPQLVPQPGTLIRRSAYDSIGGMNPTYKWAFDLDLFIRLSRVGPLRYVNSVLASFRWHPGSLTVGQRAGSVEEASRVRKKHSSNATQWRFEIWEFLLKRAILLAGGLISWKVKKSIREQLPFSPK